MSNLRVRSHFQDGVAGMRGIVAGFIVSLASITLVSCDLGRTPTRPTSVITGQPIALVVSVAPGNETTVVVWRCMAVTPFPSPDCASTATRSRVLAMVGAGAAPFGPTGLTASITGSTVRLTWLASAGGDAPSSYVVEAGSASGLADLANFDTGTVAVALTAESVPAGTYFVRVRARNAAGVSAPSNEIVVIVAGGPAPCARPSASSNIAASVDGTTVTLAWSAASGTPTSYVVEVGTAPGGSDVAVTDTGSTSTSLSANLPAGTYFARVRAKNACGTSDTSREVSFTIAPAPCPLPSAPSGLAASVNGTTVSLSWSPIGSATSYIVEAGTAPGSSNIAATDTGSTSTSLTTTLTAGAYYVRVRAKNACGASEPSNEVTATVQAPAPPPTVMTITITSSGVSPKDITISPGSRVTFVNNDQVIHQMESDPHPEHNECPEINQVGFLSPGQSRTTGNLNTVRTCGFHDHSQPENPALRGTIIIR